MSSVTPEQMLEQYEEVLELLAAPAAGQLSWLIARGLPTVDLYVQFNDAIPTWLPRLMGSGLVSEPAKAATSDLELQFRQMQHADFYTDEALKSDPSWVKVRHLAAVVLDLLRA